MKKYRIILAVLALAFSASCTDYLEVVPDNIATIDNAFTSRNTAEKFLLLAIPICPLMPVCMNRLLL